MDIKNRLLTIPTPASGGVGVAVRVLESARLSMTGADARRRINGSDIPATGGFSSHSSAPSGDVRFSEPHL